MTTLSTEPASSFGFGRDFRRRCAMLHRGLRCVSKPRDFGALAEFMRVRPGYQFPLNFNGLGPTVSRRCRAREIALDREPSWQGKTAASYRAWQGAMRTRLSK